MSWSGKKIKDTFKDLLKINSASDNAGVDSTLREVQDGEGGPTGLKLSETAVDAATLTSNSAAITTLTGTTGTITNLNSTNVNIDGGAIDDTDIGFTTPPEIIASSIGIQGRSSRFDGADDILDTAEFSVYPSPHNSTTAYRDQRFDDAKIFHDINGYFVANHDVKKNWTALEFIAASGDVKGSAWWELELWVDESDPAQVGSSSGTGYLVPPIIRACPANAMYWNDGEWSPNTWIPALWKTTFVHWGIINAGPGKDVGIGYIFETEYGADGAYTGDLTPFGRPADPSNYGSIIYEGSIRWKYIGQTANITCTIDAGAVNSVTLHNDGIFPNDGYLQGFTLDSSTGAAFDEMRFFDTGRHNDGTRPITLEKGASGGTAASTEDVTYSIIAYDQHGYDIIKLNIANSGGDISQGESWAVVQRHQASAGGGIIRYHTVLADIKGGRGGISVALVEPPPEGGNTARIELTRKHRYGDKAGVGSVQVGTPVGEIEADHFHPTGERTYFARHKGFIMSRGAYNKDASDTDFGNDGFVSGSGELLWWNNPRQKELKKGTILDGIKYGNTNLGHMHNYDPTYVTPNADSNRDAKQKFDHASGRIYNLTGTSASDWAIAESTTQAIFFRTTTSNGEGGLYTSNPRLSYTTESYGGASDYEFLNTIYTDTYDDTGGSVAVKTAAAKVAILEFPNFGNDSTLYTPDPPGGHVQVNIVLETIMDLVRYQETQNGFYNMHLPDGSNDGSFYLTFSSPSSVGQVLGIGYRLKCWTTPRYITNLRRINAIYD